MSTSTTPEPTHANKRRISFLADSILCAVIQDGDTSELCKILQNKHGVVNVNLENHVGLTALHHAALQNNLDAVKMLLCFGSEVNAQDIHGLSALHMAAACGFLPICSFLIMFGADVYLLTKQLELPIDLAKDLSIVRMLYYEMYFQNNSKQNAKSKVHKRLLHMYELCWKMLKLVLTFFLALFHNVISNVIYERGRAVLGSKHQTNNSYKNQNSERVKLFQGQNISRDSMHSKHRRKRKPDKLE